MGKDMRMGGWKRKYQEDEKESRKRNKILSFFFEVRHPSCVGSITKESLCTTQAG